MSPLEEVIDATLDANGQLHLAHPPQLPAGPVRLTIRPNPLGAQRGLSDVIREIAADQRQRGFAGRPSAESCNSDQDDVERDDELNAARKSSTPGI